MADQLTAIRESFVRTETGYVSCSAEVPSSPCVIACAAIRVVGARLRWPHGYDSLTPIVIGTATEGANKVGITSRDAHKLADLGRQILGLDREGKIQPPLTDVEKDTVQHLVDLVTPRVPTA